MAKKSSFGLGTLVGAVAGVVAGAVGVFLSDKDNRAKVVREAKRVEHVIEADLHKAERKVKKAIKKRSSKKRK